MEIKQRAKNGVAVHILKTYDELTETEKTSLMLPRDKTPAAYVDYAVWYNKRGDLIRVCGHLLAERDVEPRYDMLDALNLAYGGRKQFGAAKKSFEAAKGHKLDMTQKQIQKALEVAHHED